MPYLSYLCLLLDRSPLLLQFSYVLAISNPIRYSASYESEKAYTTVLGDDLASGTGLPGA